MHSSTFDTEGSNKDGGEVLVTIATLVTEGRVPGTLNSKSKKFYEGPHCSINKQAQDHKCDLNDSLCMKFSENRETILKLWSKNHPLCIEVVLHCGCKADRERENTEAEILLEQWFFKINNNRSSGPLFFNIQQLISAIRSQLYFSQITAWLTTQDENTPCKIEKNNLSYRLTIPGENFLSKFSLPSVKHEFPLTDIGNGYTLNVTFLSLPRMSSIPNFICPQCLPKDSFKMYKNFPEKIEDNILDDRMHTSCTLKGKHRCDDMEEFDGVNLEKKSVNYKRLCQLKKKSKQASTSEASTSNNQTKLKIDLEKANSFSEPEHQKNEKRNISPNEDTKNKSVKLENEKKWQSTGDAGHKNDLISKSKGQILLDAIERCGQQSTNDNDVDVEKPRCANKSESDNAICDMSESDIFSIKQTNNFKIHVDNHCDSPIPQIKYKKLKDISNGNSTRIMHVHKSRAKQKITFEATDTVDRSTENKTKDMGVDIPSPLEQAKFRKNLDNAASMVFHSRTGLPLTSSPAPVRRGKSCFDFDSSINSVSAIKSALFSSSFSTDEESESEGSIVSPCSPEIFATDNNNKEVAAPVKYRRKGHAANLLGSFEESVLNGRLEPVSTVHGFKAELGASGSFVPKHLVVPVTVFFYTLGDNDKVSSPYLSHINLGKKGYNVPKSGTVQVTLFNPLGTVVKMFVIMYDLSDMPPNSQTFIRQRTLYMPTNCEDQNLEWGPKWLRFLIHLRFMSSKSGKIYLHSDIRMIIFRKSDMDTATAHGIDMSYELRSFTHMPSNPRFSPRK